MNTIFSLLSIQFWLFAALFVVAIFVSSYLPGMLVLSRMQIKSKALQVFLAHVIGLVLWTAQGYIFGYLQIRWMSYLYLLIAVVFSLKQFIPHAKQLRLVVQRAFTVDIFGVCMIAIGAVMQALPVFGSGLLFADGVRFYANNAYDGVMHLSYIQSIMNAFPPHEPGSYLLPIVHYHYWGDLFMAELCRVWMLPISHVFFQYITIYLSMLTGIGAYLVMREWGGSRSLARWSLFFLYGAGELTYLFVMITKHVLRFDTPAIDNGVGQFLNVPHVFGKLIFIAGVITVWHWVRTKKWSWMWLSILLFIPLIGFKIYFGLLAGLGFGIVSAMMFVQAYLKNCKKYSLIKGVFMTVQQNWQMLVGLLMYAAGTAAVYLPANASSGGLLYAPLEWPKIFLGAQNIDLNVWWLRHAVYEQAHNIRGVVLLNLIAVVIGLLCIHGTRLLGALPRRKIWSSLGWTYLMFFIPGMIVFNAIGLLALQVSGLFNIFNFMVVTTVPMCFFAAYSMDWLWSSKKMLFKVAAMVIVVLTIPRVAVEVYFNTRLYVVGHEYHVISNDELQALKYIQDHAPKGAILQSSPRNIHDWNTPYTSYFSDHMTYLTGQGSLETHNQPVKEQEAWVKWVFQSPFSMDMAERLNEKHIDLLYLQKSDPVQLPVFTLDTNFVRPFFENDSILVLEVVHHH